MKKSRFNEHEIMQILKQAEGALCAWTIDSKRAFSPKHFFKISKKSKLLIIIKAKKSFFCKIAYMGNDFKNSILKYDKLVPRYTSYPTAPHFKEVEGDVLYQNLLSDLPDNSRLSLYVHVPFCTKMCWYCGCHTKITQRYAPVEDYAHLMMREIDLVAGAIVKKHKVTNIHFGGGSPGMLHACDFEKIMERISSKFHMIDAADIAIEIDPRGVTEERIKAYAKSGVNRISLGVQDFDDKVLAAVNRQQPFELSQQAVESCRNHGLSKFNFDLLYGLPYQTPKNMEETIEKALSLSPDRISLFGYAHVPWMKKHMRLIDEATLPDKEARYDLFETGARKLQEAGYAPIGIDHFAKPDDSMTIAQINGKLHRNFQGYTTEDTDALIGIGASSIGRFRGGYIQNAVDMPHYEDAILKGKLAALKYCSISAEDRLHGAVIERLMCDFKVDLLALCYTYGFPKNHFDSRIYELQSFVDDGILIITHNSVISIHPQARQLVRVVCAVFDDYMARVSDIRPRHAKAI